MRVLITGGAGFIGSHLVDRFHKEGFRVRVLDNLDPKIHPAGVPPQFPPGVEFIRGDVTDRETLRYALENVDVVSHQAAYQDYMPDFARFMAVNAVGTALLYELIVQCRFKVKKVIVASSQSVYGEGQYLCATHGSFLPPPRSAEQLRRNQWEVCCVECGHEASPALLLEHSPNPYNQYAVSKLAQEKTALGLGWIHGIPTVALRYSITQGPRQSLFNHYSGICRIFVSRALCGKPLLIYEDGHQTRDFVHIEDVVNANLLVLERDAADGQAFNVGSGRRTSALDYAKLVRNKTGKQVEFRIPREYRIGDNRHSVSAISKLEALGWRPKRDLSNILDDFLKWVEMIGGIPDQIQDAYSHMKEAGVVLVATS
ncbi:MAG TPA: NAD-dependent epimerase/dehydratase family protein [Candidatus Sulfotelmatobacter sp.]|nr:NAD-dependent epimerase/dehydratase family protein [Candidatus Sulfotelmatobacter sp.]